MRKETCCAVVGGVSVVIIIFIRAMVGTSLRKLDTDEGTLRRQYCSYICKPPGKEITYSQLSLSKTYIFGTGSKCDVRLIASNKIITTARMEYVFFILIILQKWRKVPNERDWKGERTWEQGWYVP